MNERGFPAGLREGDDAGGAHCILLEGAVDGLVEYNRPGEIDDKIDVFDKTLALTGGNPKSVFGQIAGDRDELIRHHGRERPTQPRTQPFERAGLKDFGLQAFRVGDKLPVGTRPRPDQEIDPRHLGRGKQDLLHESFRQKARRAGYKQRLAAEILCNGLHIIPTWTKNPFPLPHKSGAGFPEESPSLFFRHRAARSSERDVIKSLNRNNQWQL